VAQHEVTPSGPVTAWSGWDVRGEAAADAADTFVRAHESGTEEAYELLAVAARGFRPPRFLRTAETDDDQSDSEIQGFRLTWSLLYRRVAETGPAECVPYAIYLLGVNPPDGTTGHDLDVFNDFYTNVHMPEVAQRRHALRAVRFALLREIRPPYRGAPQFLAVYEVDEAGASNRRHVGPPYSSGPEVWQGHTTPWRLWYRRLS
jgi:hypothetical protein